MCRKMKAIAYIVWIIALMLVIWIGISDEMEKISNNNSNVGQDISKEEIDKEIYLNLDEGKSEYTTESLSSGKAFGERFYSKITELNLIEFKTVTWNNNYSDSDKLWIMITNNTDGSLLYQTDILLKEFGDSAWYTLNCGTVPLLFGEWYNISFVLESEKKEMSYFDLMCTDIINEELSYGIVDGEKQDWDILIRVYGK